jgi:hypothetical protein
MPEPNVQSGYVFEMVDPEELLNHSLSIGIYGDIPNDALIESIRTEGIRNPIRCTRDYRIVAGHARKQAARILGLEKVPVVRCLHDLDELEVKRQLILDNREPCFRERTTEIVAREYDALVEIEKEKAARRQRASQAQPGEKVGDRKAPKIFSGPCAGGASGEAKAIAANAVGLSTPTADKASAVVKEIDRAKAAGNDATADELSDLLNNRSVEAAYRAANDQRRKNGRAQPPSIKDRVGQDVPKHLWPVFQEVDELFRKTMSSLARVKKHLGELFNAPGSGFLRGHETDLANLRSTVKFARPFAVCPICTAGIGNDAGPCTACQDLGYLPKDVLERIPKDLLPPELAKRLAEQDVKRWRKAAHP